MLLQYESQKRRLVLIFGSRIELPDDDGGVFAANTDGDFEPAPRDYDGECGDTEPPGLTFGFGR